jgi:plasmid maintenance system antidote protein VapI
MALAARVGLPQSTVSRISSGAANPDRPTALRLQAVLGIAVEAWDLVVDDTEPAAA